MLSDRIQRISCCLCLLTFALFFSLAFPPRALSDDHVMHAHFISVGQANATLLEFSCGAVLIDGGAPDDEQVENLVSYLCGVFQHTADLNNTLGSIIITHNHIDHARALRDGRRDFELQHTDD